MTIKKEERQNQLEQDGVYKKLADMEIFKVMTDEESTIDEGH